MLFNLENFAADQALLIFKKNNEFRKRNILRINQFYALALGKLRRPYRLHRGESRSRFLDVTAVFPLI